MSTHVIAHPGVRANPFAHSLGAIRRFIARLLVWPWTEPMCYRFVMRGDPRSIDTRHVEAAMRENLIRDGVRDAHEFVIRDGFEIEHRWLYSNLTYAGNRRDYNPYVIVMARISRKR